MKILVTGIAGFIGSHLAERLAQLGHDVVGIDNYNPYYDPALKRLNAEDVTAAGATIHNLDLAEDDLTPALDGVGIVYHLAGQPGISATTPFEDYVRNNLVATEMLLRSAESQSSLKLFANIATSSVYGKYATTPETEPPQPTSYYGVTKLAAEQLVMARQRETGLPATSLRLFSVIGPRERPEKLYPRLIKSILEGTAFPLYEGSETHRRSYTYVADIVDGLVAVLRNKDRTVGEIFNIGTDVEMTTGDGIRIVEEIMGKKADIKVVPKRPGDQLQTHANIEKAGRMLGYEPSTQLVEALEAEVNWYVNRVHGRV